MGKAPKILHDAKRALHIEPDLLQGQVALKEFCVQLSDEEHVLLEERAHCVAEGVRHEAELKVEVHRHEFLHSVVVGAERQDLVH